MVMNGDDPLDAAKKRNQFKIGQSFFPAANLNRFAGNVTAGSIFGKGFDPDNPLGTPTPTPAPSPTPKPTNFQFPSISTQTAFQPLRTASYFPAISALTAFQPLQTATQGVSLSPGAGVHQSPIATLGVIGNPARYARNDMLYGWNS